MFLSLADKAILHALSALMRPRRAKSKGCARTRNSTNCVGCRGPQATPNAPFKWVEGSCDDLAGVRNKAWGNPGKSHQAVETSSQNLTNHSQSLVAWNLVKVRFPSCLSLLRVIGSTSSCLCRLFKPHTLAELFCWENSSATKAACKSEHARGELIWQERRSKY